MAKQTKHPTARQNEQEGVSGFLGCLFCRHFDAERFGRCAAYPDGIPLPILAGDVPHDRPLPGDHGIQFESVDDPEAVLDELISAKAPASD